MKKVLSVLGNVLLTIVILVAVAMTFASLNTNDNGLPEVFGKIFLNIQTGSMYPIIKQGDMVLTETVENVEKLKVDDIVTFIAKEQDTNILKTHRIIEVINDNGLITYRTKGDANENADPDILLPQKIVSIYNGVRIPIIGAIFSFLSGRLGFFLFIVLPLFVLFVYQLYKFISTIMEEKKQDLIKKIREEQKRELAKE